MPRKNYAKIRHGNPTAAWARAPPVAAVPQRKILPMSRFAWAGSPCDARAKRPCYVASSFTISAASAALGRSPQGNAMPSRVRMHACERADPMAAAGQVMAQVKHMAPKAGAGTVATVGKIEVLPNIPNVIPGQVRFVVDIRDVCQAAIDHVSAQLQEVVEQAARDNGVGYEIKEITSNDCIEIPAYLTEALENSAKELGLDYIFMPSGAVHDASSMAHICDVGMLVVPSIGGRSHVAEEDTKYEDLKAGADVLLMTLLRLT